MWFIINKFKVYLRIVVLIAIYEICYCDAISNTSFSASLRDYSADNINNITHVKTLQKEDFGKRIQYAPADTPIKFEEIPDSALSSSSHSRGLLYHDHPGYPFSGYDEDHQYEIGHDHHFEDPHHHDQHPHGPHGYDHHDHGLHHHGSHYHGDHHHDEHHYGYGHYKHYKHELATKALLWPLAGIALLGAAASLVTSPVLLQLGVVSGKRRRRDTEEITGPDVSEDSIQNYAAKIEKDTNEAIVKINKPDNDDFKRRMLITQNAKDINPMNESFKRKLLLSDNGYKLKQSIKTKGPSSLVKSLNDKTTMSPGYYQKYNDDEKYIPIAIKLRSPKITKR